MEKTICAISTPIGVGGISVIRLSGKESINIVNTILENKIENLEPRKMLLKKIKTKSFCDNAIIAYFKAPFSYTGEDVIEIQCHGGIYITNEILKALIKNGATIAENGEFTKRAFLNGFTIFLIIFILILSNFIIYIIIIYNLYRKSK